MNYGLTSAETSECQRHGAKANMTGEDTKRGPEGLKGDPKLQSPSLALLRQQSSRQLKKDDIRKDLPQLVKNFRSREKRRSCWLFDRPSKGFCASLRPTGV